ncbi:MULTISPECIES: glycosyltransferase family A protein [Enterobacterales]|uniref:glycosyltransferase family 2 protein n=1 Tax=Enterobacterales TaxID=91347 RepID=UPI002ED95AAC
MPSNKIIDVVIPSFNRLELLMLCIDSVRKQTYKINKIIIVDDNSSFSHDDFWMSMKENNVEQGDIVFHKKNENKGACHSRNLGVELSNAEYIAFLDDDDMWEAEHIERLINTFTQPDIVLSYSGKKITNFSSGSVRKSLRVIPNESQRSHMLKCNYPGSTSSILVRKNAFYEAGKFDESLPAIQDYDFYLRLVDVGTFTTSNVFTLIYRNDTNIKITNQLNKARVAFNVITKKINLNSRNILAKTIFVQNIKKAIVSRQYGFVFLFTLDFLKVLTKSD